MMKRTITEKYDEQGRLTERTIVEETITTTTSITWTPNVYPYYPYTYPVWYTQGGLTSGGNYSAGGSYTS
jgi:hypothetical protein